MSRQLIAADRLQIRNGVKFYASENDTGYIETTEGWMSIQSPLIVPFIRGVVPLMESGIARKELEQRVEREGTMTAGELNGVLKALGDKGLLNQEEKRLPAAKITIVTAHCRIDGGRFVELIQEQEIGEITSVTMDSKADEQTFERLSENTDLIVALAGASQDPVVRRLNRWAVQHKKAIVFAGIEKNGDCFVGPYWEAGHCAPCFECLQLRLSMNDKQSKLRHAFGSFLQDSGQTPLANETSKAMAAVLAGHIAEEIQQIVSDAEGRARLIGHVLWLERKSGIEASMNTLLPVPKCPACYANQLETLPRGLQHPNNPLQAVNARMGIVGRYFELPLDEDTKQIHSYCSTVPDLSVIGSALPMYIHSGAGMEPEKAIVSAVCESLERYAASLYDKGSLPLEPWSNMDNAVHPKQFGLFAAQQYEDEQFRLKPFTEDTKLRWTKGFSLYDNSEVWVPASFVYMPYRASNVDANVILSLSTGLAAGPTLEAAMLTALNEVIERDATSTSWLTKLPPRHIDREVLAALDATTTLLLSDSKFKCSFYDLSLDIPVPVMLAKIEYRDEQGRPMLHMGSAADRNPLSAMRKALLEAGQCIAYLKGVMKQHDPSKQIDHFDEIDSFQKHMSFYTKYPQYREQAGYLVDPRSGIELERRPMAEWSAAQMIQSQQETSVKDNLSFTVAKLHELGYHPIAVDLTPPDLQLIGVHVARVLVPGLVHLTGNHKYRFLGANRLYEVPKKLGYDARPDNPYPHPFP